MIAVLKRGLILLSVPIMPVYTMSGCLFEYENLLTLDVIDFRQLQACQDAAFRHAFAWPYSQKPASLLTGLLSVDNPKLPVYQ